MNFNANSPWILVCGVLGASGVALGAVASHALSDPQAAQSVQTASTYQLFHTVAILALLFMTGRVVAWSRWFMFAGVLGFSGSIYAKYLLALPAFGSFAPIGGSLLILSWLLLGASVFLRRAPEPTD